MELTKKVLWSSFASSWTKRTIGVDLVACPVFTETQKRIDK
jgi:hypothetical protein